MWDADKLDELMKDLNEAPNYMYITSYVRERLASCKVPDTVDLYMGSVERRLRGIEKRLRLLERTVEVDL